MVTTQMRIEHVARDGAAFSHMADAIEYEKELNMVDAIMSQLPKPKVPSGKYYQHDKNVLDRVRREIFALVVAKHGDAFPKWKTWNYKEVHPSSVVGRVLSEIRSPLSDAWWRFMCINFDLSREYQQPFFAANPGPAQERM